MSGYAMVDQAMAMTDRDEPGMTRPRLQGPGSKVSESRYRVSESRYRVSESRIQAQGPESRLKVQNPGIRTSKSGSLES